jgi:hypothetical protein
MESAIAKICHTYESLQASKQLIFFSKPMCLDRLHANPCEGIDGKLKM